MPWHIEDNHPDCAGFSVVKDEDGEVEGCHRTRQQAEAQLAALYASEDDEEDDYEDDDEAIGVNDDENLANEVGIRAGKGPRAIITDIDGTLRLDNGPNNQLVRYLDESDAIIIVVTARNESQREATRRYLDSIGLEYDRLEMSPGGDAVAYKKRTATALLQRYTIDEAFENDAATRAAYESLGITARAPMANLARAQQILADLRRS